MTWGNRYGATTQVKPLTALDIVNSSVFGPAVLRAIATPALRGYTVDRSIPFDAVDIPLVTELPTGAKNRGEVNFLDQAARTVTRYIWVASLNQWIPTGGAGATGTLGYSATSSAPAGGLVADGSAVTTAHPALRALLVADGSPHGVSGSDPLLPDLIDQFIAGAGSTYAIGGTGGAATIALTALEMPSHAHTAAAHTHSTPAHVHDSDFAVVNVTAGGVAVGSPTTAGTGTPVTSRSGGSGTTGSGGGLDTTAAGAGNGHENRPPYVALTPFIWS